MATTATHAQIIKEAYDNMPKKRREFLKDNMDQLKTFSQSMDSFYFYKLYSFKKKDIKIRKLAGRFHRNYINDFFITIIDYIKEKGYENNPEVMAFLYGAISHHATDSTVHPYIVYKTGQFRAKEKATWKYNGIHHDLEMCFDRYIIEKKMKKNPYKFKFYSFMISDFGLELEDALDYTFKKVFKVKSFSKKYKRGLKDTKNFLRILRYDPYGIKLFFYRLARPFRRGKLDMRVFSYKYHTNKERDFFNEDKLSWNYPTDNTIKSNKSLFELYDDSVKKTSEIIVEVDKYIYDNKKIKLDKLFNNLSYATGVDWTKKEKAVFFDF